MVIQDIMDQFEEEEEDTHTGEDEWSWCLGSEKAVKPAGTPVLGSGAKAVSQPVTSAPKTNNGIGPKKVALLAPADDSIDLTHHSDEEEEEDEEVVEEQALTDTTSAQQQQLLRAQAKVRPGPARTRPLVPAPQGRLPKAFSARPAAAPVAGGGVAAKAPAAGERPSMSLMQQALAKASAGVRSKAAAEANVAGAAGVANEQAKVGPPQRNNRLVPPPRRYGLAADKRPNQEAAREAKGGAKGGDKGGAKGGAKGGDKGGAKGGAKGTAPRRLHPSAPAAVKGNSAAAKSAGKVAAQRILAKGRGKGQGHSHGSGARNGAGHGSEGGSGGAAHGNGAAETRAPWRLSTLVRGEKRRLRSRSRERVREGRPPMRANSNGTWLADEKTIVVNLANVGIGYGVNVLKREKPKDSCLLDWEGVRRCVKWLTHNAKLRVVGVIHQSYRATDWGNLLDRWSMVEMPADIKEMMAAVIDVPRIDDANHRSADDEGTIKAAFQRRCRFLDNDNYRDWKMVLKKEQRDFMAEEGVHMRYQWDSEFGSFSLYEGNAGTKPPVTDARRPGPSFDRRPGPRW